MRELREIYQEVSKKCHNDNCQSLPVIAVIAMGESIEEYKMEIVEKLQEIVDTCEYQKGLYLIQKHVLDQFIRDMEGNTL